MDYSWLQSNLLQLIDGHISIDEFEDLYIPYLPELLETDDFRDRLIVGAIELALAELGSGIISQEEFKDYLRGLIGEPIVTYERIPDEWTYEIVTGSSSLTGVDAETSVVELEYG